MVEHNSIKRMLIYVTMEQQPIKAANNPHRPLLFTISYSQHLTETNISSCLHLLSETNICCSGFPCADCDSGVLSQMP